jgi:hypothetical protein
MRTGLDVPLASIGAAGRSLQGAGLSHDKLAKQGAQASNGTQ